MQDFPDKVFRVHVKSQSLIASESSNGHESLSRTTLSRNTLSSAYNRNLKYYNNDYYKYNNNPNYPYDRNRNPRVAEFRKFLHKMIRFSSYNRNRRSSTRINLNLNNRNKRKSSDNQQLNNNNKQYTNKGGNNHNNNHISIYNSKMSLGNENELERALKPLLWFGKLILLVPTKKIRLSLFVFPFLGFVLAVELVGAFLSDEKRTSPFDVAAAAGSPIFFCLGTFVYYCMYRNFGQLRKILKNWNTPSTATPSSLVVAETCRDKKLFRDVNFWSGLIFTSAILENAVFHFKLCPSSVSVIQNGSETDEGGFLKCTYNRMYSKTALFIPHHDVFSVLLIIANKLALYAWNFSDLLIMSLSRALGHRFKVLCQKPAATVAWAKLRSDYNELLELYEAIEMFVSPLIFSCYGINMYALCMQLNLWLRPSKNKTKLEKVYSIWSSVHLVLRVYLVSIHTARLHEHAHSITKLVKLCPPRQYSLEMVRLEEMLSNNKVAFTGLKCFFCTKAFILSFISVVFTFEVVLLQSFDSVP